MTLIIQIGNSDNKLTQQAWSQFIHSVNCCFNEFMQVHFRGGSSPETGWQNYCWVVEEHPSVDIRARLKILASMFAQDSIAITYGTTEFITP